MAYSFLTDGDPFNLGAGFGSAFGGGFGGMGSRVGSGVAAGAGLTAPERSELLGLGAVSSAAGAVFGALGALQQVRSSKLQAQSAAAAADFQASQAARNARMAELDAQAERDAGRKQLLTLGLQYGQIAGQQRVAQAASGTTMDSASNAEARASLRLAKRLDALTIQQNTARGVAGRVTQATNFRNASLMARTTAGNLRATAGTIRPGPSTFAELLGGASRAAAPIYAYTRS